MIGNDKFLDIFAFVELKAKITASLKLGENCAPLRTAQGILTKLSDCKLEMLIWFVLHDKIREY